MITLLTATRSSPLGTLHLVFDHDEALHALDFDDYVDRLGALLRRYHGAETTLREAALPRTVGAALDAYFAGDLAAIEGLATAAVGTPFQRRVWTALRDIPAGTTTSYGALAARLDQPGAARAVGLANGANPVAIVVPCHRVIGADGSLTGYGGGMARKQWLLEHEGVRPGGGEQLRLL